jgi:hypothetical protein
VLAAAIDAEFIDLEGEGTAARIVPAGRFTADPLHRDLTLDDHDASLLLGAYAMRNGIMEFAVTRLRGNDCLLLGGLMRFAAGAITFDLADVAAIVAEELRDAGLVDADDEERQAGNLLREAAIVHEELGWLECIGVRTPGYPRLRMTSLGAVGFLLLMAELDTGRPPWLDEWAAEHGRLPATGGYIDLVDVPIDVQPN